MLYEKPNDPLVTAAERLLEQVKTQRVLKR
jgi:hypothetical protein